MSNQKSCPCNSNKPYLVCCGPFHKGKIHAPTAEALMRSRFSAYVLNNYQYIYRTWYRNTRPPLDVLREDSAQLFTNLEIINTTQGSKSDDEGTVEFIASFVINNDNSSRNDKKVHQHHENSYFLKKDKKWKYINELSKINVDESE